MCPQYLGCYGVVKFFKLKENFYKNFIFIEDLKRYINKGH